MSEGHDAEGGPSLWRELADGSASHGVRALITLALAAALCAICFITAYTLSFLVPEWDRAWNWTMPGGARARRGGRPTEELTAVVLAVGSLLFLLGAGWLWSRAIHRMRPVWYGVLGTIGIGLLVLVLGILAAATLYGDQEIVIAAIIILGIAAALVLWVQLWRRFSRARPMRHRLDGHLDLRCPQCGYRMVGLREARCPECGTVFTLDELLARQDFLLPAPPLTPAGSDRTQPQSATR